MRIPDPVGGFTRMPDPVFFLIALSTPVVFLIALRTCLICVLLMSMSTPVLFLIARSIFFDLPGGQVQSVATTGYSFVFKSERNCFSSPKSSREVYLLPI